MIISWVVYLVVAAFVIAILGSALRVLREYERGVMFTLGRFTGVKGPGLILILPYIQQMVRVDLRIVVLDVPSQDVISRDNVSVKVTAVLYFRVVDSDKAVIEVKDFMQATSQLAQTTLRSVLGKHSLDEMLAERDKLNQDIQEILDAQTESWGIKVTNVEMKQVDISESMIRAIAKQAEAERLRRAKIINAEGEQQAAQKLVEAAEIIARAPGAMQLRYLGALHDIASDRSNTIVLPCRPTCCSRFPRVDCPRPPDSRATATDPPDTSVDAPSFRVKFCYARRKRLLPLFPLGSGPQDARDDPSLWSDLSV